MILNKVIFIILSFSCLLFPQTQTLQFNHFQIENGLSQSTVQTILQDKKGFLWIGTKVGLNKFDGYKFYNYIYNKKDSNSISDNFITAIYQDKNGNLWIGTRRGLNKFAVNENSNKNIDVRFLHFLNDKDDDFSLSHNDISAIYQSKYGDLWIGTSNGLNKISADQLVKQNDKNPQFKFKRYFRKDGLSSNSISSIVEDDLGHLWIGTLGGGLNMLDTKTGKFSVYSSGGKNESGLSSNYVMTLYLGRNNILWIGTYAGGLVKLEIKKQKFTIYKNTPGQNSISVDKVLSIEEDTDRKFMARNFRRGHK